MRSSSLNPRRIVPLDGSTRHATCTSGTDKLTSSAPKMLLSPKIKRFFSSKDEVPTRAVTMGMGNIMRAQSLLMIIGGNKEEAARKLLVDDKIDPMCPATFMRLHRDATVIIEKDLCDKIGYRS